MNNKTPLSIVNFRNYFLFFYVYQDMIILYYHVSWFLIFSLFITVILDFYSALFFIDLIPHSLWFSYTKIGRMYL